MLEVLLRLDTLLQSITNRENVGDHAAKHWAGLVDSYYFSRWNIFFQYVTTNVFNVSPVNQSPFEAARITLDTTWNYEAGPFPTKPGGDPFTVTQELVSKYADVPTSSNYKISLDMISWLDWMHHGRMTFTKFTSSVTQTLHVSGTIPMVASRTLPLVVFNQPKELRSS